VHVFLVANDDEKNMHSVSISYFDHAAWGVACVLAIRACEFTCNGWKAGDAGEWQDLLPESEVPSHPLSSSVAGCGKTSNSGKIQNSALHHKNLKFSHLSCYT